MYIQIKSFQIVSNENTPTTNFHISSVYISCVIQRVHSCVRSGISHLQLLKYVALRNEGEKGK